MFDKLGILALPRTGSSALYYYITDIYTGYRRAFEPMNTKLKSNAPPINDLIKLDHLIIKHLLIQEMNTTYDEYTNEYSVGKPNISYDILKTFDTVILLTRKDKIKMYESLYKARETDIWFQKYDDTNIRDGIENYKFYTALMESDKYLSIFSIQFNIPIFYYEDIFYNQDEFKKLLDYAKLPFNQRLYDQYIDVKNKYRQEGN
jgi:hypothetical protein